MQRKELMAANARLLPVSHNLQALRVANFAGYCASIPAFKEILKGLQAKGWLTTNASCHYSMINFLQDVAIDSDLDLSPVKILAQPLPEFLVQISEEEKQPFPEAFKTLESKLENYEELLIETLNNKLAQQDYEEGIPTQENVSERVHALQAGKIASLVMPPENILPMLLHDIARPTNSDQEYGHAHHCNEGSDICAPLGLSINYTLYHALAKYLLFHFCQPYTQGMTPETKGLISPVSTYSLPKQTESLGLLLTGLQTLEPIRMARFFYSIMFMRLIDDFSKVPVSELSRELRDKDTEYFSDKLMANLFRKQLVIHLHQLDASQEDIFLVLRKYELKLDVAISLLMRARQFTNEMEASSAIPRFV